MGTSGRASFRGAVVIVANDRFTDYAIPFLESFRTYNPRLPLIAIPFDSNIADLTHLSKVYQFSIYEGSFDKLDRFTKTVFGNAYLSNRMRKLMAFDMDFDEFLYIDTDIVVLQDLSRYFGHIVGGRADLIYVVSAGQYVYRPEADRIIDLQRSKRFATGLFASSKRVLSLDTIIRNMERNLELFHKVRYPELYDQPLLNFVCDSSGLRLKTKRQVGISGVYGDAFYDPTVRREGERVVQDKNNDVTLLHWAGPEKFRPDIPFAEVLLKFTDRAKIRICAYDETHPLSTWRPFFETRRLSSAA
jgi:lipopolysaccharide biosynthesis glycosyltransferase